MVHVHGLIEDPVVILVYSLPLSKHAVNMMYKNGIESSRICVYSRNVSSTWKIQNWHYCKWKGSYDILFKCICSLKLYNFKGITVTTNPISSAAVAFKAGADPGFCKGRGTPLLPVSVHTQEGGAHSLLAR